MEPLAPLVDQMRDIAREELPGRRTCRIQLFDDATFSISITHSMGPDESQRISYVRSTGEIIWEHAKESDGIETDLSGSETLHEPIIEELDARVIETVEPPYKGIEFDV